jgi:putative acetyltransferase
MSFTLRPIQAADNAIIAQVIRTVLIEMDVPKVGTAFADPSLDHLYEYYQNDRGAYFVAEQNNEIVAGCGVGSLPNEDASICELQKMYMLSKARGQKMGEALVIQCLETAKSLGYQQCYIETMHNMLAAQSLYKKMGFTYIDKPMGNTGHNACPVWMLLKF